VLLGFSIIVLGITANLVSQFKNGHVPAWLGFTLFVAIFSLLIGVPILVIDKLRRGAITSFVVVELAWTAFLGLLWLAAAADQSSNLILVGDCSAYGGFDSAEESLCHQLQAMQAFSWLNWLLLWGWTFILLIFSIIAMTRGNPVWTSPAGETDFFARNDSKIPPAVQYQNTGGAYPPTQQQQQFAPQFTGQTQYGTPHQTTQPIAQV